MSDHDRHTHSRPDTAVDEKTETAHDPLHDNPPLDEKLQVASGAVDSATKKRKSWFRKEKAEEPAKAPAADIPKQVSFTSLFRYVIIRNPQRKCCLTFQLLRFSTKLEIFINVISLIGAVAGESLFLST